MRRELGITILENLVALTLVAVTMAGASKMIISGMHANKNSREFGQITTEVNNIISAIDGAGYGTLLNAFATSYPLITDGQTVTYATVNSTYTPSSYVVTLEAIKNLNGTIPESLIVRVATTHNRVKFGSSNHVFETIISGAAS